MNSFLLGGPGELRALAPEAAAGASKLLFSLEDRHPIALELDVNLGLFRLREARGVAFVDVGMVGERGFRGMNGDQWRVGGGYGLRLIVDLLGLSPLLVAADVAIPLDPVIRDGKPLPIDQTRFLVGSYQAF